ncbi:pollen receptor-like kinase 4 [Tanacetum coccineum]
MHSPDPSPPSIYIRFCLILPVSLSHACEPKAREKMRIDEMEFKKCYLDLILVPLSFMISISYHVWLWHKVRTQPLSTVIGTNAHGRRLWVSTIMKDNEKKNILAVQTIRNSIMGSTLMATTSILLCSGLAAVISSTYSVKKPLNDTIYGAHGELMVALKPPYWLTLIFIHVLLTSLPFLSAQNDSATLIKFRSSLTNFGALNNWDVKVPPCNTTIWTGIICKNGSVSKLQLENMGLGGTIDVDTLAEITSIRTLSFINNSFEGSMPNLAKFGPLRGLFLSNNKFSGDIEDDAFKGFSSSMTKVELANNEFTGNIPTSLTQLSTLIDLQLQNNKFDGKIPDFEQTDLKVNFSNNRLDGSIPKGLSNQDPSAFAGSGSFGSSYKAMLVGGPAVVVKRFKEMSNVGKEDFHAHMRLLGSLEHPNLLPLVSFYYKKDEKLLITDFAANGSLASHLHGKFTNFMQISFVSSFKLVEI